MRPILLLLLLGGHVILSSNVSASEPSKNIFKRIFKNKKSAALSKIDPHALNELCASSDFHAVSKYRGGHSHHKGHSKILDPSERSALNMVKLILTACLTSLNVACWFVPLKVKKFTDSKLAISLANAFSGGVFLSLAFGHMIPHSQHGFEHSNLPSVTPYYITLAGYMVIFFVEKIAFDAHELLHDDHSHSHSHKKTNGNGQASGRSSVVLLLALSVHSLFETMALGLSDSKLNAFLLATSISLHQPAESLALLVSFLKTGLSQGEIVKMLSVFSCVGPIGVFVGMIVAEFAGEMMDAVLVALAAGTFIYVGATEVIADEFEGPEHKWKKFGALVTGVVLIGYIISWAEALEGRIN